MIDYWMVVVVVMGGGAICGFMFVCEHHGKQTMIISCPRLRGRESNNDLAFICKSNGAPASKQLDAII